MPAETTLDPEAKDRWVAALESGDYKQARGYLCVGTGASSRFDALGVLYDTVFDGDWHPVPESEPVVWLTSEWSLWLLRGSLSERPLLTTGQGASVGLTLGEQAELAGMGDDGKSFAEIAGWIETHL